MDRTEIPQATPSPDHDGNALADLLGPEPVCCGGGKHDGHDGWCAWGRISAPVVVLGEPVGPKRHRGRGEGLPCGYCNAPGPDGCLVTPLPGPVVELHHAQPVAVAGRAAGWT